MQRERHKSVALRKTGCCQRAQVQWRAARDNDFRELLPFRLQRRVLVDRVFEIRRAEERCPEDPLIVFEVLWRVLDE